LVDVVVNVFVCRLLAVFAVSAWLFAVFLAVSAV